MHFIYSHCSGAAFVPQLQTTEWEVLSSKWMKLEAELLRERAIFGPGPGVILNQDWVQDAAEGPNRTRARIRRKVLRKSKQVQSRNFEAELMRLVVLMFPVTYLSNALSQLQGLHCMRSSRFEPDTPRTEGDTGKKMCLLYKVIIQNIYISNKISLCSFVSFAEPKILCEVGAEAKEDEEAEGLNCEHLTFFPKLNETHAVTEDQHSPVAPTPCSSAQDCPDIRIILRELHPQEEVLFCSTEESVAVSRRNHQA